MIFDTFFSCSMINKQNYKVQTSLDIDIFVSKVFSKSRDFLSLVKQENVGVGVRNGN